MGESTVNRQAWHVYEGETISASNEASAIPLAPHNKGLGCWQGTVWSRGWAAGMLAGFLCRSEELR